MLQPTSVEPQRVEILKLKRPTPIKQIRRLVCRLVDVGPAGSAIIAKRSRSVSAAVERTIYEEILPFLPVSSPEYFGMVEEVNGEFGWIFLEDAGDETYSPLIGEQSALAARWLGRMHTSATQIACQIRDPNTT